MIAPHRIIADDHDLLPDVRELYGRLPETRNLLPWELGHVLWSLGYTDNLATEAEIAAAVKVARSGWSPDEGVA